MVEVARGSPVVVEDPAAGAGLEAAERPLVDGVVEAPVPDMASQDSSFLPGGNGEGRRSGVVSARLGTVVAFGVVSELCEHPGAEDDTESWQGKVDVGVRVFIKMVGQLCFEFSDLGVQSLDDPGQRSGGSSKRCSDRWRCRQLRFVSHLPGPRSFETSQDRNSLGLIAFSSGPRIAVVVGLSRDRNAVSIPDRHAIATRQGRWTRQDFRDEAPHDHAVVCDRCRCRRLLMPSHLWCRRPRH